MLTSSSHTVDGTSSVHQLRLVGYPMIFRVLYIPGVQDILPSRVWTCLFGGRFSGGSGKVFWSFVHIYGVALHPSPSVGDYLIEKCWINQLPSDKVIWLPGKNTRCRCISLWQRELFQLDSLIHRVYIHFWFHMGYNQVYMFQSRGSYARFSVCLEHCLIYLAFEQSTLFNMFDPDDTS